MKTFKLPEKCCSACRFFDADLGGACQKRAPQLLEHEPRRDVPAVGRNGKIVAALGIPKWPAVDPSWLCGDFANDLSRLSPSD